MTSERDIRIEKAQKLRDRGHDPYHPARFERSDLIGEVRRKYESSNQEANNNYVSIGGRVTSIRNMGQSVFVDVQDQTGTVQVYAKKDNIGKDKLDTLKECIDVGDWLGVEGPIFKTRSGELSVDARGYRFLTKSIRPLPLGKSKDGERFSSLDDPGLIYSQPEIGLATDRMRFETLQKRTKIIRAVRENLWDKGFDETDTPVLEAIYGGANARPFVTHVNALNQLPAYLRISLELPLKRLIVGGFDGVFNLGHVFRNEGLDRSHNPEFTLLEVYKSMWDYTDIMNLTEEIITNAAQKTNSSLVVSYGNQEINLKTPWRRVTMHDILKEHTGVDISKASDLELKAMAARHNEDTLAKAGISRSLSDSELVEAVNQYNAKLSGGDGRIPIDTSRGIITAYLFEELVEPKLIQPTFVIDHPKETSPLCKPHRTNPELIERFELFINGWEFANAYSELNDPVLQRRLLEEQAQQLRAGQEEAMPMDEAFVKAIEYGMPTTGGLGIGIDRLVMLLTGHLWPKESPPSIRDVIFFPLTKPQD